MTNSRKGHGLHKVLLKYFKIKQFVSIFKLLPLFLLVLVVDTSVYYPNAFPNEFEHEFSDVLNGPVFDIVFLRHLNVSKIKNIRFPEKELRKRIRVS